MKLVQTKDTSLTVEHPEHGQSYHSQIGARTEAQKLYIEGSSIALRLSEESNKIPLAVLDLGLGLGYNAIATIQTWMASGGYKDVYLYSLEIDAKLVKTLLSKNAPWQENWPESELKILTDVQEINPVLYKMRLKHPKTTQNLFWEIHICDAISFDFKACHPFDYIWQDAFSIAVSPKLWQVEWFTSLFYAASKDAELLTYSVAREVKDALKNAGWKIQKIPGVGTKREWLKAYKG